MCGGSEPSSLLRFDQVLSELGYGECSGGDFDSRTTVRAGTEGEWISWMVPLSTKHPHAKPQQKQPTGKKRKQRGRTQTLAPVSPSTIVASISSFV